MTTPTGGRWIFSVDPTSGFSGVILGINNGVAPVFPAPVAGKFNIEVFTNPTVSGLPSADVGFNSVATDPNGTLDNTGHLTGTNLRLGSGDFLAVDDTVVSGAGGAKITLGSGKQTVVGAKFDTLAGGSGAQILSALLGNETVIGGSGNASIFGGANDSIVAGTGANQQIVVTGSGTTVVAGTSGTAVVSLSANDTLTGLGNASTQTVLVAAGTNNLIDLTGNTSAAANAVIGNTGDTITGGSGVTTNVEGSAGQMRIKVGAGGTTAVSGSTSTVAGNTVTGSTGAFNYNPGATAGKGDLINLTGTNGTATINAFSFQGNTVAAPDTILASQSADSIFGGAGDRIGTGSVQGAGTHQWTADTVANSSVGFGSNSSVVGSTAQVTVGNFKADDFLFYQNETQTQNNAIVAAATAVTIVTPNDSSRIILPDGTTMTLVGVTTAQLQTANTAGTLFKA